MHEPHLSITLSSFHSTSKTARQHPPQIKISIKYLPTVADCATSCMSTEGKYQSHFYNSLSHTLLLFFSFINLCCFLNSLIPLQFPSGEREQIHSGVFTSFTRLFRLPTEESVAMFRRKNNTHSYRLENEELCHESKVKQFKAAIGPLSGRSLQYCTDACFKRYLEARNWNVDKAKKMLEETLKWRSTCRPEEICWNEVAKEGETGKLFRASFHDRHGRTVLILRPGLQNAILNLPESQEQMAWLIDFSRWSLNNSVPVKSARETTNILQNHYPERLAIAFLYNPPRIFEAFWKAVKYFLDAKTFQKVKFVYPKNKDSVEVMSLYFDEENLPTEFGGKATLRYDHEEFSKLMVQDDAKSVRLWGSDDKLQRVSNGQSGAEVALEPANFAPPAS